jgi:hypothetical protein
MMHTDNIRRRENGTIDIDFYRREAFLARRATMRQSFRRARQLGRLLIEGATIAATYALLLPRDPRPPGASSIFVSANVPLIPTKPNQ